MIDISLSSRMILALALILIAQLSYAVSAFDIDNQILGDPEIQCGSDTVEMQFRTQKPFRGNVYVKGQYSTPGCRENFNESPFSTRPIAGIVIPHGTCHMERQRMINPEHGMQFSAIVVISFHPKFITKIDRAFHIKCMYRELSRTVQQGIEVSALSTTAITHEFPVPTCRYTIHKDEIDGEVLRYASVGELVVHRWECDGSDVYGILVHSCYVEDGQGEKVEVIDKEGCKVDDYILGEPTYVEALNMAYREAHVIKFADRVTVRFMCQIRLCMKIDDGCKGITPPACARQSFQEAGSVRPTISVLERNTTSLFESSPNVEYVDYEELGDSNKTDPTGTSAISETTKSNDTAEQSTTPGSIRRFFFNRDGTPLRSAGTRYRDQGRPDRRYQYRTRPKSQHRFYRSVIEQNKTQTSETFDPTQYALVGFQPVDGDFMSQMMYVLDTTEEPDKETAKSKDLFFRKANAGGIVATNEEGRRKDDVCLSVTLFSMLMGALTCIFIAAAFAATMHCCRKLSILSGSTRPKPASGPFPGTFSENSSQGSPRGGILTTWTDKLMHKVYKG